jgi:hypothetical protein
MSQATHFLFKLLEYHSRYTILVADIGLIDSIICETANPALDNIIKLTGRGLQKIDYTLLTFLSICNEPGSY